MEVQLFWRVLISNDDSCNSHLQIYAYYSNNLGNFLYETGIGKKKVKMFSPL
jgi:hypothetical protein